MGKIRFGEKLLKMNRVPRRHNERETVKEKRTRKK